MFRTNPVIVRTIPVIYVTYSVKFRKKITNILDNLGYNWDRKKQTETNRNRQKGTEMDRNRQK